MERFSTIRIEHSTVLRKEGMEIEAYIAGVNSGAYSLPFIIAIRTWTKWIKRFTYREMKLNIYEIRTLRDELNKAIEYHDKNQLQ